MTEDLIAFIRARLDETEEMIRYCLDHGEQMSYPDEDLADIAAKRKILDLHDRDHECSTYSSNEPGEVDNCTWVIREDWCSTVRLLGQRYATRPGWRSEWDA